MSVTYRLGVSAFVCDAAAGHAWTSLGRLPVRHFEIGTLHGADNLEAALEALQPVSFGIHWPLSAADGHDYQLLASPPGAFTALLRRIRDRVGGSGARYLLLHLGQRGEPWPDDDRLSERLTALATLGQELGVEIVLEPKESVAQGDGLSGFLARVSHLPAGMALCLDTNDWVSAARHIGRGPECLQGRAAYFHLHAMHVRPGSGGLYLHAPPWVAPGADPPWPEVHQPRATDLDVMADRGRVVAVQVEVHPRYAPRMSDALAVVRTRLGSLGWVEHPD